MIPALILTVLFAGVGFGQSSFTAESGSTAPAAPVSEAPAPPSVPKKKLCEEYSYQDLESELTQRLTISAKNKENLPIGSDGYINANTAKIENSGPHWLTSAQALEQFPAFTKFKFIDPANPEDTPIGASGSTTASSHPVPTKGYCTLPTGSLHDI